MASRNTQETRIIPSAPETGGNSRVTHESRIVLTDANAATLGGNARVTQHVRVVIATIPLGGANGFMLQGLGS
jgi:hypothetical protein